MDEDTEVTVPTTAQAWIHLLDGPIEPIVSQVRFCGHSFRHAAQVLMGDASPKQVSFIVFGHITPKLGEQSGLVVDCEELEPIFEFGHELVDL